MAEQGFSGVANAVWADALRAGAQALREKAYLNTAARKATIRKTSPKLPVDLSAEEALCLEMQDQAILLEAAAALAGGRKHNDGQE